MTDEVIAAVRREALRLLKERLDIDGHVGNVSEIAGADASTWTFVVTFSDVSDTSAEITVDARSSKVVSSSIGGGL